MIEVELRQYELLNLMNYPYFRIKEELCGLRLKVMQNRLMCVKSLITSVVLTFQTMILRDT